MAEAWTIETTMATCCDSSSCSSNEHISYLILGDGDFSFSYDLARRILLESSSSSSSVAVVTTRPLSPSVHFTVTATGIDTLQEVESKYKDSAFLLKKLNGLNNDANNNNNNNNDHHHLTVSVQHGVNAILPLPKSFEEPGVKDEDHRPEPADIVLFNHPHLGFEDANLHSCFLAHLLDSVDRYWLKKRNNVSSRHCNNTDAAAADDAATKSNKTQRNNDHNHSGGGMGIFFLTLALGQWERWKGDEAVARLGLFIVNRLPFQAPLDCTQIPQVAATAAAVQEENAATTAAAVVGGEKPYFQLRRHQTGKSFANRRKANTSETFALARLAEKDFLLLKPSSSGRLFWYSSSSSPIQNVNTETTTTTSFSCPFCDRTFSEQRSVKNHIRCKHTKQEQNVNGVEPIHKNEHSQSQQQPQQQEWECPYCSNTTTTTTTTSNIDSDSDSSHISKRRRRVFDNQQALNDHIKAKHQALHSHIPPDYKTNSTVSAITKVSEQQQQQQSVSAAAATAVIPPVGICAVCLEVFTNAQEARHHINRFIPPPSMTTTMTTTTTAQVSSKLDSTASKQFACSFCHKPFREKRARLQHENFCASRPEVLVGQS